MRGSRDPGPLEADGMPPPAAALPVLVEGCVTSLGEASLVAEAGGHRVELCRDLPAGGLTPSLLTTSAVLDGAPLPVFAMLRPQPGGFLATPPVLDQMLREMEELTAAGVQGVVLGVLDAAGGVDVAALREMVAAAPVPVTFHRAFDEAPDSLESLHQLLEAGVSRVLTAGGRGTAWEGRKVLRKLVLEAGDDLVILGGGRVREGHVVRLVEFTGLREVHARASAVPGIARALGLARAPELATPQVLEEGPVLPGGSEARRARGGRA
jgi:copper homeostasis protein